MQLLLQPGLHNLRQVRPVDLMGLVITDLGQRLIAVLDHRGAFIRAHRGDHLHHVRYHIRIFHHNLIGFLASQIGELLQHLVRGMQKKGRLVVGVLEASPRHDDPAVDLVLRIQKMHVAGGHHWLVELLAQLHHLPVHVLDVLQGIDVPDPVGGDHELIVAGGLNLQIVVKVHDPGNLHVALAVQQGAVKLPGLAGAAQNEPLPILLHQAFGNPGMPAGIVGQMGLRHQTVQIDAAHVVLGQNDGMVSGELLHQLGAGGPQGIELGQCVHILLLQHLDELHEDPCGALRVVHRPVMVVQGNVQGLCHRVQSVLGLVRQQHPGDAHRVHVGMLHGQPLPSGVLLHEAHVESRVVCHQHAAFAKFQEPGQHLLDQRRVCHHVVPDAGEFLYLKGNRHLRVHEGGEPIHHLAAADLHRADFYDSVVHRGKSRSLDVEHHEILLQCAVLVPGDDFLQIVHQIGLHPIDDLEEGLLVRRLLSLLLAPALLRLPEILPHMIGVREPLHHAVVRDGDGPMAPLVGALYDVLGLGYAVEIAHLGMAVELHPLMGGGVIADRGEIRYLLDAGERSDGQLMVEFVQGSHAPDLHEGAHFQAPQQLLHEFRLDEELHGHGVREIRHIEHDYRSFVPDFTAVRLQHLPPDGHLSHLADDVLDGHGLILEVLSIDHVGIVGLLQGPVPPAEFAPLEIALEAAPAERALPGLSDTSAICGSLPLGRGSRSASGRCARRTLPGTCGASLSGFPVLSRRGPALAWLPFIAAVRPQIDLIDLQLNPQLFLLGGPQGLRLPVGHLHPALQAAALHQYLLKHPHKLRFLASVQHGVVYGQQNLPRLRVGNLRCPKGIVFDMAVLPQLRQDALPVSLHQILRRILGGELKALKYPHLQKGMGKKLALDRFLRGPDVLLQYQAGAEQIDGEPVPLPGGGHPLHRRLLQHVAQCPLQLQRGEYFKKRFRFRRHFQLSNSFCNACNN